MLISLTALLLLLLPRLLKFLSDKSVRQNFGFVDQKFDKVAKLFASICGVKLGSALVVYHKGQKVIELHSGIADANSGRPWQPDTLACVHNAGQFIGSLCLTLAKLCCQRKQNITQNLVQEKPGDFMQCWLLGMKTEKCIKMLDNQNRSIHQFWYDEIAQHHKFQIEIGTSVKKWKARGAKPKFCWKFFVDILLQNPIRVMKSLCHFAFANNKGAHCASAASSLGRPHVSSLCSGVVGTPDSLARFLSCVADGKILPADVVSKLSEPLTAPATLLSESGAWPVAVGKDGFCVVARPKGGWMLGNRGFGGQLLCCDAQQRLGFAFVTNCMSPFGVHDQRPWHLLRHVYRCLD